MRQPPAGRAVRGCLDRGLHRHPYPTGLLYTMRKGMGEMIKNTIENIIKM